jgi:hypothetical protein
MVHWRPHYPATKSAEAAKGQERPLLAGIGAVKFSYFGTVASKDRDAPARWHDEWTDQRHLPKLIRIELDFDDADRYWPELTVALPIRR